jgi:hypothetical protein
MRLDVKALAIVGAVLWGGCFCLISVGNLFWPSYGVAVLEIGASIYPGYAGPDGLDSVIVVTLYAVLDGAVGGAVAAWVYNRVAGAKIAKAGA